MTMENAFRSGFVAIIGRPNVGKSTLLNRILGQKISITSSKPQTTRNRILGIHNFAGGQALFVDTPGIHAARGRLNRFMVDQAVKACADVDLILMLTEAGGRAAAEDTEIVPLLQRAAAPVILVINKIDLIPRERLLGQIDAYRQVYPFDEIIPVSARSGDGVDRMIQIVETRLPHGERYYPEDMLSDQSERFFVAELIREKIMRRTGQEVPYGCGVSIDSFAEQPDRDLVVIQATVHVERQSHKKMLVGRGGQKIKALGQEARQDIQRLLGARVFLELFVRVDKDWSRNERMLKELGYGAEGSN